MTRGIILLAGLVALSAAFVRPALADVYYVTYTGTASGVDSLGLFGTAGATITNAAYTSTYTYDPSTFGATPHGVNATQAFVYGGTGYPGEDPFQSANLVINGKTFLQNSSYLSQQLVEVPVIESYASGSANNVLYNFLDWSGENNILSLSVAQSYAGGGNTGGYLTYNGEDIALTSFTYAVTDGAPTPVPEPASFALLGGAACVFAAALTACRKMSQRGAEAPGSLAFA
jgi:hypothetical protein